MVRKEAPWYEVVWRTWFGMMRSGVMWRCVEFCRGVWSVELDWCCVAL